MGGVWAKVVRWAVRLALPACALPGLAVAQVSPAPAPQPLPTRDQVVQPAPPVAAPARGRVTSRDAVAQAPCPLADSPLRVTLTSVRFVAAGRPELPAPIAAALARIAPPAGEVPLSAVCTLRDEANAAIARAGFVASVQVPPQQIADGTLTLNVVLARIVEVRVRGEAGRFRPVLARAIARLQALDPLDERAAERILLLTGDVPGLDLQLALRPAGSAPGDVIGELAVATQRVQVIGNAQNYGSPALGRETAYLRVDLNALAEPGDTAYVGVSTTAQTREQQVVQAGYRATLSAGGLTAGPRVTVAWSRPDIGELDLRSRSIITGFDITQPIVRSVRHSLLASLGFEAAEQRIRIHDAAGGTTPLNRDRLRAAYLRLDGRTSARRDDGLDAHTIGGSLELRQGLDILGATQTGRITPEGWSPSRLEGEATAFIARTSVSATGRIDRRFSVAHTVLAQWASAPLLNFDEQAAGNLTVGLGYDPGANSGDRFVGWHSEARADVTLTDGVAVQPYAFADNVWLWNLDSFSTETGRQLRSIGAGLRARLPGPVLLDVAYARPLDRALAIDRARAPARLLVSLTAQVNPRFLP